MSLTGDEGALLADLRERLQASGIEPLELLLFGPRARGERDADIDLCLVFSRLDAPRRSQVETICGAVGFDHGELICPLLCTSDEFDAAPPLLVRIRAEGRSVF